MELFLINGIVRLPFVDLAGKREPGIVILMIGLLSAVCSIAAARLMQKVTAYNTSAAIGRESEQLSRA